MLGASVKTMAGCLQLIESSGIKLLLVCNEFDVIMLDRLISTSVLVECEDVFDVNEVVCGFQWRFALYFALWMGRMGEI